MAPTTKTAEAEKKNKRSKLLYAGVIIVLIVFFIIGFIIGLSSVLKMEGTYYPEQLDSPVSPIAENDKAAQLDFLNSVVEKALQEKPKFARSDSMSFSLDAGDINAADTVRSSILYIQDGFESSVNDILKKNAAEADFMEGFEDLLRVPKITAADIKEFKPEYYTYKCLSCGATSDEQKDQCDECGSNARYQWVYTDSYTYTYVLNISDTVLGENYNVRSDEEIRSLFGDQLDHICNIKTVSVVPKELMITIVVKSEDDELQKLTFSKVSEVDVSSDFIEESAALGTASAKAGVTESETYSFTWPSIRLSAHTKDIEPKSSKENLLATLTFPDASQDNVTWTSSDESIVTVDDAGYLKTGKKTGDAVISATYEYNGKPYTDTCEVHVKYSVESVSIHKKGSVFSAKKLSMGTGDTVELMAKISPKKATITSVKWYSLNEAVATVDENGVVKAVSPGTATILAVTDDLNFKSTCEVTVK